MLLALALQHRHQQTRGSRDAVTNADGAGQLWADTVTSGARQTVIRFGAFLKRTGLCAGEGQLPTCFGLRHSKSSMSNMQSLRCSTHTGKCSCGIHWPSVRQHLRVSPA